ncbi:MAG: carbohydrate-binding domain-containing protein [Paludibacteraceae bacterium]
MKKIFLFTFLLAVIFTLTAGNYLFVFQKDNTIKSHTINTTDSIKFVSNQTVLNIHNTDLSITPYSLSDIDSITFGTYDDDKVTIIYKGSAVQIINPLSNAGISVTATGADVIINASTSSEITYNILGNTPDGMLKIYSNYKYKLVLNNVSITNLDGPAINIQSSKKCTLTLTSGSVNTLADGAVYTSSSEDQKATLFSEGQIIFNGNGILNVSSVGKHAICSDDYISIEGGTLNVTAAAKDAIHTGDYFKMSDGTLTLTPTSDGIDSEGYVNISGGTVNYTNATADTKAIASDSIMNITGGTFNLTIKGNQSKGLKADNIMTISGGTYTINTSGGVVLTASSAGNDVSYCTAIKCDSTINLSDGNITIVGTGISNKGISSDENINISGGTINITNSGNGATYKNILGETDSYSNTSISADGNVNITNGNVTVTSSGTAAKGISADGTISIGTTSLSPTIKVTNTGTKLLVSGTANYTTAVYADPKGIKSDGNITINNGTFTLSATQQGAEIIDSDGTLDINGGTFTITMDGNQSKGLKSSGTMNLTGGTIGFTTKGGVTLENVTASSYDPSYCTAIKGDGIVNVSGSNITITASGAGSRGISADGNLNITGGTVKVSNAGSGATYTNSSSTTDGYSPCCITSDANISIINGMVTLTATGKAGKGINADGTFTMGSASTTPVLSITTSGTELASGSTSYASPKAIKADGNITFTSGTTTISSSDDGIKSETNVYLYGGTITVNNSYEAIEAPYIYVSGAYVDVTATNDAINATKGTVSGGTESNDGSCLYIISGTLIANCTSGDAIDSNGNIVMSGGLAIANGPSSGVEEAVDFNGSFNMNGGTFIGAGSNSNMTKAMSSTSTQPNMYVSSSSIISSSTFINIRIGTSDVITFKPKNGGYKFLFSSPSMTKGASYTIYTGGSYSTSTNTGGYYTGGTYTTGTSKKTGTLSTSSTVNTISF